MSTPPTAHEIGFEPLALLASLLFPGAGHWARGEKKRGMFACAGVMGLFVGGLLVGGVDAIDRQEDRFWFLGQALVGPTTFAVDYYHQNFLKVVELKQSTAVRRTAYPTEGRDSKTGRPVVGGKPPNTKSLSKVNELAMLSCCLAGMMNLIVIIDAGFPTRGITARQEGGANQ